MPSQHIKQMTQIWNPHSGRSASKPVKQLAQFVQQHINDSQSSRYEGSLCKLNIIPPRCGVVALDESWVMQLWFDHTSTPPKFMHYAINGGATAVDVAVLDLLKKLQQS